ncbi:complement C5-like [Xiphias gladius]|uniref:complement C5-like n=1 Tax=Xiphias gladius TaxID=8245 RepID=UPI001A99A83A|nr:complement C5-like [Xiphias gladius]
MRSAANYISQHATGVKSVYVRAVATYALTLHDPNSMAAFQLLTSLENLARQKGHPAVLRYWQESSVTADWLKPDESSGVTVETTAYVLLTVLLKVLLSPVGFIFYFVQVQFYFTLKPSSGAGRAAWEQQQQHNLTISAHSFM